MKSRLDFNIPWKDPVGRGRGGPTSSLVNPLDAMYNMFTISSVVGPKLPGLRKGLTVLERVSRRWWRTTGGGYVKKQLLENRRYSRVEVCSSSQRV